MNKEKMDVVAGIDIGNGYTKGKILVDGDQNFNGEKGLFSLVDMPSDMMMIVGKTIPQDATDDLMKDFYQRARVSILSPAVNNGNETAHFYVGTQAAELVVGGTGRLTQFNINSSKAKAEEDLSICLILETIASAALEAAWTKKHALPEEIDVSVWAGLALPVSDYIETPDAYEKKLCGKAHTVKVWNFGSVPVTVNINFARIESTAEGLACQIELNTRGPELMQMILDLDTENKYSPEMFLNQTQIMGIDVGSGTTNFVIYGNRDGFSPNSRTINSGIGNVWDAVHNDLKDLKVPNSSSAELADFFMQNENNPNKTGAVTAIRKSLDQRLNILSDEIMKHFNEYTSKMNSHLDAIMIYGGGAEMVKDRIIKDIAESTADLLDPIPVLYIPSKFSRIMNRNGMYIKAKDALKKFDSDKFELWFN